MRVFSGLLLGVISVFPSISWGGLATAPSPKDKLLASSKTTYFWSDGKVVVSARCKRDQLIKLQNCGKDFAPRRTLWLKDVEKHLADLLPFKLQYEKRRKALEDRVGHLENQIALRKAKGITEGLGDLELDLKEVRDRLHILVSPESALKEFTDVLTLDPDLVVTVGEGLYPTAESNVDLLEIIFKFVAPEDTSAVWCENKTHPRKLWVLVSEAIGRYELEEQCNKIGARLPQLYDFKGPAPSNIYAIHAHGEWVSSGCPKFARSPVGNKGRGVYWLEDKEEGDRVYTRYISVSASGGHCQSSILDRTNGVKAVGVCIVDEDSTRFERQYWDQFPMSIKKAMPCQ